MLYINILIVIMKHIPGHDELGTCRHSLLINVVMTVTR